MNNKRQPTTGANCKHSLVWCCRTGVHAYHDMWPNIGIVIFISDYALIIHVLLKCQEFERTIRQKISLVHKWIQIFI
jgi:hypothetical protein